MRSRRRRSEFFERARARLNREVPPALTDEMLPGVRGDLDLDPVLWEKAGVKATKPAAVLIPVVARAEPMVLLTQRTADLSSHSGQIAFPGGRIDPRTRVRSPPRCAKPRRRSASTRS